MIWAALVVLLTLVWLAVLGAGVVLGGSERGRGARGVVATLAYVVLLVVVTAIASAHTIPSGNVGVVRTFGRITSQTGDGLVFTAPWQTVEAASVQVQRSRIERVEAFTSETQDVFITVTINYAVDPGAIQELYRNVGANWYDKLVPPRAVNFLKEETVKYTATDIAPNRERIRTAVRDRLRAELATYSISLPDFLVDNIDFPNEFKDAIVRKQVATQDALRAQAQVEQRRQEANGQVEQARGEAESTRLRAEGQASANRALAASLSPEIIQYETIQKLSDKVQVIILPPGSQYLIDPRGALPAPAATPTPGR